MVALPTADYTTDASPRRRRAPRSAAVEAALTIDPSQYEGAPARPQAPVAAAPTDGPKIPWRARKKSSADPLHIPPELIPAGMVYQWKRKFLKGEEDEHNMVHVQEAGAWSPVPGDRPGHGSIGTKGARARGEIGYGGLVLMERPIELDNEARMEELSDARGIREIQMQKLGLTPRGQLPATAPRVRRSMEEPTG